MSVKSMLFSLGLILILTACGGNEVSADKITPEQSAGSSEAIENTPTNVSDMKPAQLIQTAANEIQFITKHLTTVVDESSAKEATTIIRERVEIINAAVDRFENFDDSDMKPSMKIVQPIQDFSTAQLALFKQMERIATEHPEITETIKNEFNELKL